MTGLVEVLIGIFLGIALGIDMKRCINSIDYRCVICRVLDRKKKGGAA